jgi:putative DNA methylase
VSVKKKLIEVALPLEAINREAAREKSIRHGHPSTLHLWWARRPLAACRAVLFAQLVDDPSSHPEQFPTEEAQERERQRLFSIIEDLVKWENSTNEHVLARVRAEIRRSCSDHPPSVLDPFCGGGSIPLEAQRLGLEAHASDLNPVAVLITKALIEIPSKFAGRPPVHPFKDKRLVETEWRGARGLAEDVRYYGQWMRDEVERRIGYLYPKVTLPAEYGGREAAAIAWLWARTVKCPNPACGCEMPLLSSFVLSAKPGRERYLHPVLSGSSITFDVRPVPPTYLGDPKKGYKRGISGIFQCAFCKTITTRDYVASEGVAHRLGQIQTAVVVAGGRSRIYLPAEFAPVPSDIPKVSHDGLESELSANPRDVWCRNFGLFTPADLFTPRQFVTLTTFSDLVDEVRDRMLADLHMADISRHGERVLDDVTDAKAYTIAIMTYLGLGISKLADYNSSLVVWSPGRDQAKSTFARQALPMVWDFVEVNPFAGAAGDLTVTLGGICEALEQGLSVGVASQVTQCDASVSERRSMYCFSTDPPYYDNIGYADLSDFFYVWLRRSIGKIYPSLFATLLTPKAEELVAMPYRFDGDREKARAFFERRLGEAFRRMCRASHPDYPLALFYAFKQSESEDDGELRSTGWETMLEGLLYSGLSITGTWPMRSERGARSVALGTNSLASSIVLVCRPRPEDARPTTRREFLAALKRELPEALRLLQHGNIAPVDLAQASIGPGMAIFSRYAQVLEAGGTPMRVRTALALINQTLDEVLAEQEGEFDADTRWALAWFEQFGLGAAPFGEAETLSKAKNTSVQGLADAGLLDARGGKVRLLKREELDGTWDPASDPRLTVWEVTQHLIRALEQDGEAGAAALLARVGPRGDAARDLAYRLYQLCERKGRPQEALAYNSVVIAWPQIVRLAAGRDSTTVQTDLFA